MARSRSLIRVRRPPIEAVLSLHKPRRAGWCPWCGQEITERTPIRKQLKVMHAACSLELAIITDPACARRAVLDRDKGICCDCGDDWSEMSRFVPARRDADGLAKVSYSFDSSRREWPCTRLVVISLWQADHKTPLWKVAHMPDIQRIDYFKLANLVTRCEPCHSRKTGAEAGERARFDAMAGEKKPKVKKVWASRPMGYRPAPRVRDINDD